MSGTFHYHDIAAAVALRINALVGTDPVELQTTYSTRPLTDELFDSSIIPFNSVRDSIVQCEGKIAQVVSLSANRTLRAYLRELSDPTVSGDPVPTGIAGAPIIGNFGAVLDADDGTVCTPQPVPVVRNRLLAPNIYLVPAYYFAIDGATVIHTRTWVQFECCVYDAATQTAAFDRNGVILFPDSLAEAYINGAMALLVRDDEFVTQSQLYAQFFTTFLGTLPPATMESQAA